MTNEASSDSCMMRAHPKRTRLNQTVELLTLLKKKTTPCFPFSPLLTNQQKTGKTLNCFFHISSYGMPNAAPTIPHPGSSFCPSVAVDRVGIDCLGRKVAEQKQIMRASGKILHLIHEGEALAAKNPLTTRLGWLPSASATVQWTSKEIWSATR